MASKPPTQQPNQSFAETERLFRRVHRDNLKADGKPTVLAFELPDMSVNREQHSTAADVLKGFEPADWGVVAFLARDIPPRATWKHIVDVYSLVPRHVPLSGNFAHSEIRVRRLVDGIFILITARQQTEFDGADPDRGVQTGVPSAWLDPDFHMRWRKHIAMAATPVLLPVE